MKTRIEIIDEIAGHYNLLNRSTVYPNGSAIVNCRYNGPEGKHCAFAYMCIDPSTLQEGLAATAQLQKYGQDILKPEFRGYDNYFYQDIQYLHDEKSNW